MPDPGGKLIGRHSPLSQQLFVAAIWGAGIIGIAFPVAILSFLIVKGIPVLSWSFLVLPPEGFPLGRSGGIAPAILGSLSLISVGLMLAVPAAVFSALYTSQYCISPKILNVVRFSAEVLAAVPSILYGLFGYALLVVLFGLNVSLLAGGITLGLMMVPVIFVGSHEAFNAASRDLRQAVLSLGVSKAHYIGRILLPKSVPAILTVVVLASMHAMGSAAPVLYTAAIVNAIGELRLDTPVMTLPTHIFYLVGEAISLDHAFGTALVLVAMLVVGNASAGYLKQKYKRASDELE